MEKVQTIFRQYGKENTNLMADFLKSMESEELKNLVKEISLPYEELCKYTSQLEESALEYQHCKHCKGLAQCQNQITGYAYLPHVFDSHLMFEYQACRYRQKQLKEDGYLKNVTSYAIPREIRKAQMKDIITEDASRFEIIQAINQFLQNYRKKECKGIYLYGNFGSGKTYLLSAMLNELAKKNIHSAIVFFPEFLQDLKSIMNEKDEYRKRLEQVRKVPILVLDDIGAENITTWSRDEILCPILQYRMQEQLPTFFTSNLDWKALEKHFSMTRDGVEEIKARRIIERMKQMTIFISMIGKNMRK